MAFVVGSGSFTFAIAQDPIARDPSVQDPAGAATPAPAGTAAPPAAAPGTTPAAADASGATAPAAGGAANGAPAHAAANGPAALGTLLADAQVRCWPTENSPGYEDRFAKGATVAVGRSESGFRQVLLPLGPVGWVHKDFATAAADGKAATKPGTKVAFRAEPKSGRAPIALLDEGSELWIVGEQGSWWRVRNPGVECWLPEAAVQVFEQPPETMQKAAAELAKVHRGEVEARLEAVRLAAEQQRIDGDKREALKALQQLLATELAKPAAERQLAPVASATEKLLAELSPTSTVRPDAEELQRRVAAQQWVAEATAMRDGDPPPPAELPDVGPGIVKDPLERFQAVGFLRWEKGLLGPGRYVIEKGGQRLYVVSCDSGRYDLALFVDMEVGIVGPRRRPATESMRLLEAEKIEVLAAR